MIGSVRRKSEPARGDVAAAERANALPAVEELVAPERRRGRGAVSNRSGRFEPESREAVDDGWGSLETLAPFKTEVTIERPRSIITRNDSPDISFDRSINP